MIEKYILRQFFAKAMMSMLVMAVSTTASTVCAQGVDDVIGGIFGKITKQKEEAKNTTGTSEQQVLAQMLNPGENSMTFGGYSQSFNTIRPMLTRDHYRDAYIIYSGEAEEDEEAEGDEEADEATTPSIRTFISTKDKFLRNAELGIMLLEQDAVKDARSLFDKAEAGIKDRKKKKKGLGGILRRGKKIGANIIGRGGLSPYEPADYEQILQLNYLTLSYLLEGKRKAFNVSRRASAVQLTSRENFQRLLEEKGQAPEAEGEEAVEEAEKEKSILKNIGAGKDNFFSVFERYSTIAERVPNAYVNPLGFYVTALVYEIDSAKNPEFLGNARESYTKALELSPASNFLREAVVANSGVSPSTEPMIHVLMAEGFSPSRQLLEYGLKLEERVLPVKIPILVPNETQIHKFEVRSKNGTLLSKMEPFADIEAIMMRSQQDRLPLTWTGVALSVARSVLQGDLLGDGGVGSVALTLLEGFQTPDMRSWSSLPRRFHLARIPANIGTSTVEIRALNDNGAVISSQTIPVHFNNGHAVIYGRATMDNINFSTPEKLWH